jgi:microcin C transport system substrate-binding protein
LLLPLTVTLVLLAVIFSAPVAGAPMADPLPVVSATETIDYSRMLDSVTWQSHETYVSPGSVRARKGGVLRSVSSAFPPTMRIAGKNSNTMFHSLLRGLMYETLLGLDPITLEMTPGLARRWAVAEDKQTFFFEIDSRARWSDGKSVIASDVVVTWDLMVDPGIDYPFSTDFWGKFERPVALASNVVMIRSKQLNWRAFMSAAASLYILPAHYLEGMSGKEFLGTYQNTMMPGSGPYAYESSRTNEEIILKRRPDWWQAAFPRQIGLYNFDVLHYIFIQDDNLIKERFKKGDLDWHHVLVAREWHQEFTPAAMPQVAKGWVQRVKVFTHEPMGVSGLAFNLRLPPFNDKRVRQAIAHLFNREKLMNKLFYNEYEFTDSMYPNSPYEHPDTPKMRFNPDRAVELLEEAGWLQANRDYDGWLMKDGKRFQVNLNCTSPSTERVLTVVQEDFRDVGIDLRIKHVTWATEIKEVGERNFTLSYRTYGGLLFPNPESSLHSKFADQPNSGNIFGFKQARVDEICASYPFMFDVQERIQAVREIDKITCDEHLYAFGWHAPHVRLLFWNKFGMPRPVLGKTGSESDIAVYWWYDEEKDRLLKEARTNDAVLPLGPQEIRWWDEYEKSGRTMDPKE